MIQESIIIARMLADFLHGYDATLVPGHAELIPLAQAFAFVRDILIFIVNPFAR